MATTKFVLAPESAHFPSDNYANIGDRQARPTLDYDGGSTNESAYWTVVAPQGLSGTLTAVIYYMMKDATTGNVRWGVAVEAIPPDTAFDLDAGTDFDTGNEAHEAVPGVNGYMSNISITLTNKDSVAAGDYLRFQVYRDASDTTNDTATGDAHLLVVEIREG